MTSADDPAAAIAYVQARFGGPHYRAACDLRERVLRRPLGIPLRDVDTAEDSGEELFCALQAERVIACLHLKYVDAATMKLRQMAVDPAFQKSGVGSGLVRFAEGWARGRATDAIVLDARIAAAPFYERLGYAREGEPFESVGIPHIRMRRSLGP